MLKALDSKDNIVLSYKDEIDKEKRYFCPSCSEILIFVDAKLKIKHFRHQAKISVCETEPETERHIQMKLFFMDKLNLNRTNLEVKLPNNRADLYIPEEKIAIEVQHSKLSFQDFIDRTKLYDLSKISVIWVFDLQYLNVDNVFFNLTETLRLASKLYGNRIFIWDKELYYLTFQTVSKFVEPNDFSSHHGYIKDYKLMKLINKKVKLENFKLIKSAGLLENYGVSRIAVAE